MGITSFLQFIVRWTIYVSSTVVISALGLLYLNQTKLIYPSNVPQGSRITVAKPSEFGMNDYQEVDLNSSDGTNIKGYFIRSPSSRITLIYYHANAGNMGHRLPIAKFLFDKLGCNVFMLSYRGYGLSEGEPNETGLKMDGQAALDYVTGHDLYKDTKIILYGQSIGGAVAIHIASKNQGKVDALIVENTFTSIADTIQSVFGLFGFVKYFCHQKWNSLEAITAIDSIPILFLSGQKDELVPPFMMKELYNSVLSRSKQITQFAEFENGTHNDTCIQPNYFEAIVIFWKKAAMGKGQTLR